MRHSIRSLMRRWYREQIGPDGIQRRRSLLARDRAARRADGLFFEVHAVATRQTKEIAALRSRNHKLSDSLKALEERVPVYTRVQRDEQRYGRTFVIPLTFNPDVIVRTLVFSTAERDRSLDLDYEFRYLVAFASEKILTALHEAAAERLGMPGRTIR